MIKPIENENLLEDNKRKIEKALEEKRKGDMYGWSCPMNFERCGVQCPYFRMSHPANRCLNREKFIQTKEGMELTPKQLEQLGIKNKDLQVKEERKTFDLSPEKSGMFALESSSLDNSPVKSSKNGFPEKEHLLAIAGASDEYAGKGNKKFNKTQILFIILIGLVAIGILLLSYYASNGYFHSTLNSTLVDNSTCIMPDIPSCPTSTCTCPAPNLTLNLPYNFFGLLNQSISNNTNSS